MKRKLSQIWKYVVGGGTVLGYQAFIDRMSNNNKQLELTKSIKDLQDKIDKSLKDNEDKTITNELLTNQLELKNKLNNLLEIQNKFFNKHANLEENSEESKSLFKQFNSEFTDTFNKAKKLAENIENDINSSGKNFIDSNFFTNLIKQYKEYLSTLSTTEICLVINISSSLFILGCLTSIIFSIYGNFLIDKLNLVDKYPKLAKFIQLRVKLQHSYILFNSLLITIALIGMIIVNFITLTHF